MASKRPPTAPEAFASDALVRREGFRLLAAVALLLAAALMMAGGLLWHEQTRSRAAARPSSVTAAR